jgi:hypothetical protein
MNMPAKKNCIIEARDDSHEWDSDYVGNESMTLGEALQYIRQAESGQSPDDQDWTGWKFRVLRDGGDGVYRQISDDRDGFSAQDEIGAAFDDLD